MVRLVIAAEGRTKKIAGVEVIPLEIPFSHGGAPAGPAKRPPGHVSKLSLASRGIFVHGMHHHDWYMPLVTDTLHVF